MPDKKTHKDNNQKTKQNLYVPTKKCLQQYEGVTPILTNAFLEQIKNKMQNLSNTKVFKVTKGCLKNLARAKNKMRAQKK